MIRTLPGFWWNNNHSDGCTHTLKIPNLHIQGWTKSFIYNKTNEETTHVVVPFSPQKPTKKSMIRWNQWTSNDWMFFFPLDLWTSTGFRSLCGGSLEIASPRSPFHMSSQPQRGESWGSKSCIYCIQSLQITIPNDTIVWNQKDTEIKKLGECSSQVPEKWDETRDDVYFIR